MNLNSLAKQAIKRVVDRQKIPRKWWFPVNKQPEGSDPEHLSKDHQETSAAIRRSLLALIVFSFFCTFTLLGAPDIELVRPGSMISVPIPFGSYSMSFTAFLTVGPIVLLCITFYLHAFLQHWRTLQDVPQIQRVPYLFNLPYRSSRVISQLLFYWLTPLILLVFWWKVIPLRNSAADMLGSAFLVCTLWSLWLQIRHCPQGRRGWNIPRWILLLGLLGTSNSQGLLINSGLSLSGADLSGQNLSGRQFTFADLRGATLKEANLSHANLRGANLRRADLSRANLSNADMRGALLNWADLSAANLEDAWIDGAFFSGATMIKARLKLRATGTFTLKTYLNWQEVISFKLGSEKLFVLWKWPEPTIEKVSINRLSEAIPLDLSDIKLVNADLSFGKFPGAILDHADLSKADMGHADLSRAQLSRAIMADAELGQINLRDANLAHADLSRAKLFEARLNNANLSGANFSAAYLAMANLSTADLSNSNLSAANLSGADLSGANLSGADLSGADLFIYSDTKTTLSQEQLDSACANVPIKNLPKGLKQPPPCSEPSQQRK